MANIFKTIDSVSLIKTLREFALALRQFFATKSDINAVESAITDLDNRKIEASDIPTSLPANGGNADTVDNLHASDFVRAYPTYGTSYSIDSDWGQSIVTFDPVVGGTYPFSTPNSTILNLGNDFIRRKQLFFDYDSDNIYFRRHRNSSWTDWVRIALASDIPTSLPANGGNADYATSAGTANSTSHILYNNNFDTNYGNYAIFQQYYEISDFPHDGWFNSIKMLHSNSQGFFTEIATSFTGEDGMWRRELRAGEQLGWYKMLDSGNFNSYAPKLDGTGASGTWGINISGNAASATNADNADTVDNMHASDFATAGHTHSYLPLSGGTLSGSDCVLNINSSTEHSWIFFKTSGINKASVGYYNGFASIANEIGNYARIGVNDSGVPQYWSSAHPSDAKTLYHSGNLTASVIGGLGTLSNNISGNAASASKLETARTLTIGNTGKSFDGSSNVSWTLSEIGAASSSHTHTTSEITNFPTSLPANGGTSNYTKYLRGRQSDGTYYGSEAVNNIIAEWNTKSDNRWYLKAASTYECRVDYATSAGNASTLGGRPVSDFILKSEHAGDMYETNDEGTDFCEAAIVWQMRPNTSYEFADFMRVPVPSKDAMDKIAHCINQMKDITLYVGETIIKQPYTWNQMHWSLQCSRKDSVVYTTKYVTADAVFPSVDYNGQTQLPPTTIDISVSYNQSTGVRHVHITIENMYGRAYYDSSKVNSK